MSLLFGFLLVFALVGVGVLVGITLTLNYIDEQRERLRAWETELQAQWDALQGTNRIGWSFWLARERMRDEATRYSGENTP